MQCACAYLERGYAGEGEKRGRRWKDDLDAVAVELESRSSQVR